ncbi:hypothetical protein WR25_20040 [Diploscapter pachys]|uniref:AMP-dependent synthetase/ligase domain-containing protein n=1 Tax=Diploscapter pachys TaxID=2018661 RepID=A0A2A2K8P2_9BILA|nr:hypothetical protein WR25_20040 [Diploscapter pachys]
MADARWFRGATLNFAEHLLQRRDDRPAVVAVREDGGRHSLTHNQLAAQVAGLQQAFRQAGIAPGDRIAAVIDQVEKINQVVAQLPSIEQLLVVPHTRPQTRADEFTGKPTALWADYFTPGGTPTFAAQPFDHPLYILPKYLAALEQAAVEPAKSHGLGSLRLILCTGSPLSPHSYDYVYAKIKADVCLASMSGGTDIVACFVAGNPLLPVRRGEISGKGLGMAVEVWDEQRQPVSGAKGELVCIHPFPSMPLGFWGDADGQRYRDAYFSQCLAAG